MAKTYLPIAEKGRNETGRSNGPTVKAIPQGKRDEIWEDKEGFAGERNGGEGIVENKKDERYCNGDGWKMQQRLWM